MLNTEYPGLSLEGLAQGILLIRIVGNGPMNSVDNEVHQSLNDIWMDLHDDSRYRVAVITGAGQVFSAGGDLNEWSAALESPSRAATTFGLTVELIENMIRCRKPIISAINGPAVGVALAVALLADISIIGESARIGDGHIRIGLPAGDHAALVWPLLCGMARSKYYLLTGKMIDGREAARIGLVSLCVGDDEVLDRALSVAEQLSSGPEWALQGTKRALNHWLRLAAPTFESSAGLEVLAMFGPEAREGLDAFLEKRRPNYR